MVTSFHRRKRRPLMLEMHKCSKRQRSPFGWDSLLFVSSSIQSATPDAHLAFGFEPCVLASLRTSFCKNSLSFSRSNCGKLRPELRVVHLSLVMHATLIKSIQSGCYSFNQRRSSCSSVNHVAKQKLNNWQLHLNCKHESFLDLFSICQGFAL